MNCYKNISIFDFPTTHLYHGPRIKKAYLKIHSFMYIEVVLFSKNLNFNILHVTKSTQKNLVQFTSLIFRITFSTILPLGQFHKHIKSINTNIGEKFRFIWNCLSKHIQIIKLINFNNGFNYNNLSFTFVEYSNE